jgi:hypothetical protein
MDYLKKNGLNIFIAFWLIVVAVQYISSYFYDFGLDFKPVYYVMLVVIVLHIAHRGYSTFHPNPVVKGHQTPEAVPGGKKRKSRCTGR